MGCRILRSELVSSLQIVEVNGRRKREGRRGRRATKETGRIAKREERHIFFVEHQKSK